MENIKVGCIPVRQAINIDTKSYKIKKFLKDNKIVLIVGGISFALFLTYMVLLMNFIKLIKIIY